MMRFACTKAGIPVILGLAVAGCSSGQRGMIETVVDFRDARERSDIEQAEALLAPNARIYFDDVNSEGMPIDLRTGWGAWDREMDAAVTAESLEVLGDTVTGVFHEENDFSRLLGFDGWWSRMTYWFDDRGRIARQLYEGLPDRPSGHDEARAVFTEWAEANRPDEFNAINPIEPSTESARRWRMLLIDWRRATGQPMPRLPGWEARLTERVRAFLLAGTWEEFIGQTSPDYRLWFGERTGEGMGRADLREIFAWDKVVQSRPELQRIEIEGDVAHTFVHEENDFTRLINSGGFNMNVIFRFDRDGRIREQLIVDQGTMPAFNVAVQIPIAWLAANRADELAEVYVDGQMVFTGESAEKWLKLLREWRRETGQPPVD